MIDDRLGEIRPTGDGCELVFERRLAQPVAKVWAALTVPERISEWLMTRTEVELRVGGRFALDWIDGAHAMVGEIVELDPPRLIAWTWPHEQHPDSVVRWVLTPEGEGCRLTLTQTHMRKPHVLDVAAGWHAYLECLPGGAGDDITAWSGAREKTHLARYEALSLA
ncbi:MAG: SRPBCC family protein [Phenylobacterium sp.]